MQVVSHNRKRKWIYVARARVTPAIFYSIVCVYVERRERGG